MTKPLYSLEGVKKDFSIGAQAVSALDRVSLSIASAEWVALVGPSGSGKSTLLNLLGLIETPSLGSLRFDGTEVMGLSEGERAKLRRQSIGFVFQNFNLIPILTALENVLYPLLLLGEMPPAEARERARESLSAMGLGRHEGHRPAQLSGGQRQRVAIARAIVKRPKVVLADEPTANLDSVTAKEILKLLGSLRDTWGTTILLATHDPVAARAASRRVCLKDGRMEGTEAVMAVA
jgi:putative ABC transport system ATP-binding protein